MADIRCVEVGVHAGDNAIEMIEAFPQAKFFLVDSYNVNHSTFQPGGEIQTTEQRSNFITGVKRRIENAGARATLIIEESVKASRRFPDEFFDYIYIDAQHDKESTLSDIKSWFPKLRVGGLMAGHDIGAQGVRGAVNEYFNNDYVIVEDEDWMVRK